MSTLSKRAIWEDVAQSLVPQERLTPDEWAEKHRVLKQGTTGRPGRWRSDPWQKWVHNTPVNYPAKEGFFCQKPSQIGISETAINKIGYWVDQRPCPILYLLPTREEAQEFEKDRFSHMIDSADVLRRKFLLGRRHHETMTSKEFHGGRLRIYGHGSSTKLKSHPYRVVIIDEVNEMDEFPSQGSALEMARARTFSFMDSWIEGLSTPTHEEEGITPLVDEMSTCHRPMLPCPACGEYQWFKFPQITYERGKPETAVYECEHCGAPISDAQRVAALSDMRIESMLEPEEAARRPYVGVKLGAFCSPRVTFEQLVAEYERCHSEAQIQVFYNHRLGRPYTPSTEPVRAENLNEREMLRPSEKIPADVRAVTAGVDVQRGAKLYVDISAWDDHERKWLVHYEVCHGWERLRNLLLDFEVEAENGTHNIQACAIDSGDEAHRVYNFCSEMGTHWVIPTKYASVPTGQFWKGKEVRYGLKLYKLRRSHWMGRAIGRFKGDADIPGVVLPIGLDQRYRDHVMANRMREKEDRHGNKKIVYELPKGENDDYLQAAVNAEFVAKMIDAIDRLEEQADRNRIPVRQDYREGDKEEPNNWVNRRLQEKISNEVGRR